MPPSLKIRRSVCCRKETALSRHPASQAAIWQMLTHKKGYQSPSCPSRRDLWFLLVDTSIRPRAPIVGPDYGRRMPRIVSCGQLEKPPPRQNCSSRSPPVYRLALTIILTLANCLWPQIASSEDDSSTYPCQRSTTSKLCFEPEIKPQISPNNCLVSLPSVASKFEIHIAFEHHTLQCCPAIRIRTHT